MLHSLQQNNSLGKSKDNRITSGRSGQDKSRFKNIKAENYWLARMWFKEGGKILKQNEWHQMVWIKYKISTDKVLQIEPKEDLKGRTGKSPDFSEAVRKLLGTKEAFE